MKSSALAFSFWAALTAAACLALTPLALAAEEKGDWTIRVGASKYHPKGTNGRLDNPLAPGTDLELDVENAWGASIDLSRMLTNRWSLELMAQLPAKHLVKFEHGVTGIGNVTVAETTRLSLLLNLQYHLNPGAVLQPYLGAGLQASFFFDEEGRDFLEDESIRFDDAVGLGLQVGIDLALGSRWLANVSLRYLWNESKLFVNDEKLSNADVGGMLWGLHLGYRFH